MDNGDEKKISVWGAILLVVGNMIGAGILALPIQTGLAGFIPNLFALIPVWFFMTATAVVIAKASLISRENTGDFPSMFRSLFAHPWIKGLATGTNLFILFGLLAAYLDGMVSLVRAFLPMSQNQVLGGVFIAASAFTVGGIRLVSRFNSLLVMALWGAFFTLIYWCLRQVSPKHLVHRQWLMLPYALPILVAAFHFHNIVPSLCSALNWDEKAVFLSIVGGSLIGFFMNFLWLYAVLGVLPYGGGTGEGSLVFAHLHGQPATLPLAKHLNISIISVSGQAFALTAILTSFMSNGVALQHFLGDLLQGTFHRRCRTLEWTLTLGFPLWIVYRIPELFLKALDTVGGIGIVIIFGLVPGLLAVRTVGPRFPRYRTLGYAIGLFFWILLGNNLIGLLHPPKIGPQILCPTGRK